jgi:hypothetical protein
MWRLLGNLAAKNQPKFPRPALEFRKKHATAKALRTPCLAALCSNFAQSLVILLRPIGNSRFRLLAAILRDAGCAGSSG